jgi:hypothetical protein
MNDRTEAKLKTLSAADDGLPRVCWAWLPAAPLHGDGAGQSSCTRLPPFPARLVSCSQCCPPAAAPAPILRLDSWASNEPRVAPSGQISALSATALGCLLPDDCPALSAIHQRLLLLQRHCLLCIRRLCCRRHLLLLETLRQHYTSTSLGCPQSAGVADSHLTEAAHPDMPSTWSRCT